MPSYTLYLTLDHRLDCTKAKVQYTAMGESATILNVEDPEFLPVRSCFNELLHGVEEHQAVVKGARNLALVEDVDDGA